jgi:hypothetical protein
MRHLYDFLSLKNNVNVASKSNKQKNFRTKMSRIRNTALLCDVNIQFDLS